MSDLTMTAALNKLAKWRKFFASWQLGSRPAHDGEYKAVAHALEAEAEQLSSDYADAFPGWHATPDGLQMALPEALDTMHKLGFPP